MYNLSRSTTAINTANNKTQLWQCGKTKNHGYKKRQILKEGNVELTLNIPYVVERNYKNNKSKKLLRQGQGFFPMLRWLSMEEGVTPLVWSTIAKYGAVSSSFLLLPIIH